jgi:addiction module RelB/DinJ family antitoxin
MNTTMLIKLDKTLKANAKQTAEDLGIPLTTVVSILLKQFVRERQIMLSLEPKPSKKKIAEWEAISDEMDKNVKNQKVFSSAEELFKHLKI